MRYFNIENQLQVLRADFWNTMCDRQVPEQVSQKIYFPSSVA